MSSFKKLLILKLGDTLPELAQRRGDFEHWFITSLQVDSARLTIFDPRTGADFPPREEIAGLLLTGSHSMVTEHLTWSERTAEWTKSAVAAGLPALGVCYGHQLLAYAFGGQVGDNPNGAQEGTTTIELTPEGRADPLLGSLGHYAFDAQVSHAQSVLKLPPGATRLAFDAWDANQAFRIGKCAWGVQFHPEMDADIVRAYIRAESPQLRAQGQNPDWILGKTRETPIAAKVLQRFVEIVFDEREIHSPANRSYPTHA